MYKSKQCIFLSQREKAIQKLGFSDIPTRMSATLCPLPPSNSGIFSFGLLSIDGRVLWLCLGDSESAGLCLNCLLPWLLRDSPARIAVNGSIGWVGFG